MNVTLRRASQLIVILLVSRLILLSGCARPEVQDSVIREYSMDELQGVIAAGVAIDHEITADGKGSLRIDATEPITIELFETGDVDIELARLIYQAKIRTQNVHGQVYLEMWCHFPELGNYFSRALHAPISGSVDWVVQETPFFLQAGQNPDNIKLNLVIEGSGTAWIDDIRLLRAPL